MFQLRNLINRFGVPTNPEKNMKAAEDLLLLLLHAHIVAAAEKLSDYDFDVNQLVKLRSPSSILTSCFHHLQV